MARVMKDSGIEWLGQVPECWELRRLQYILRERNEKNIPVKTSEILSLTASQGVIPHAEKEGGGNKPKEDLTAYKLAYPDDIVMNSMNVLSGAVGLSKYYGCVSPVYYMLYSDDENIDIRFYNYMFKTKAFQRSLMGLGNGILIKESDNGTLNTIRMRIPMEKLSKLNFVVPNIVEQRKIVEFLDEKIPELDAIVLRTKESIEEYKKYRQAVITEAVSRGVSTNVKLKDSGNERIGEIPTGWRVAKVKTVSHKVTDGAHVSPEVENGVYDFISTVNVGNGFINFENCLKTSEASYKQLVANGCKPEPNDVLISKDGTVGKTVVIDYDKDFVVASSLVIIKTDISLIMPKLLDYNLQSRFVQEQLTMLMHGSALKRVSVEKNANLPVVLPPLDEQLQIVEYLDKKCAEIDKLIAKKEAFVEELVNYKQSLIYEYVTGKKEVL